MRLRRLPHLLLVVVTTLAVVAGTLLALAPAEPAQATSSDTFQAGNIISDQNFFDANAMSVDQIQSFLNGKISGCATGNCLNVLTVDTTTRTAAYSPQGTLICTQYTGAAGESAATVIFKVQQACSVSAKVILVTLQKEEGLVTKTSVSAATLARAMGYGCPDSANGACDALYYGFYNQVYDAAKQLRRYGASAPVGNYQPGVKFIQYSPSVPCGGSNVNITNRATAALYNYTPYQPDQAALANMFSVGDSCSSYGNRNFWRYYNSWFGDPTVPAGTPEGNLNPIPSTVGAIAISGWAVDPDAATAPVVLSVQLDQSWYVLTAGDSGPDLSSQYVGAGSNHYFSGSYPVSPGNHTLCIYLVNAGGAGGLGSIGCQNVAVPFTPTPIGGVIQASSAHGVISFSGWAVRPDAPTLPVHLATVFNNAWTGYTTNLPNSAAVAAVPAAGPNQGFAGSFAAAPGAQTFCLWADPTKGPAVQIGCTTVVVAAPADAATNIDSISGGAGAVSVSGWAVYPDSPTAPVNMAIQVGTNWYPLTANQPSTEPQASVPAAGPNQGFSGTVPLSPGTYSVCIWVTEPSGAAANLGCQTATVTVAQPTQAHIDSISGGPGSLAVAGWAIWPDRPASSVNMAVQVDSSWYGMTANGVSAEGAAALAGAGPNHGFSSTIPAAAGAHQVCVWAGSSVGAATNLGCALVTVTSAVTQSHIDFITGGAGALSVAGWTVWPDKPTSSVNMAVQVDSSSWYGITANGVSAAAAVAVTGAGSNHGFASTIPATPGSHLVCLWAGGSTGGATNIGCSSVAVAAGPPTASHIDAITGGVGSITVSGWAVWPNAPASSVNIAVQVAGTWTGLTANESSPEASAAVPGAGANHGFSGSVSAGPGTYQLCVWAGVSGGGATDIGCQNVTVTAAPPMQSRVDSIVAGVGAVSVAGWAVWPDKLSTSVNMAIQVDANWYGMTANATNVVAPTVVAGAGNSHGFSATQPVAAGAHTVCVWAGLSGGGAINLGCQRVTVG